MGWAAVITLILQIFGPALSEWIRKWLESRLKKAMAGAGEFPAVESDAPLRLVMTALNETPWFAFARRNLLRILADLIVARQGNLTTPMTVHELSAVGYAGEQVDRE